MHENDDDISRDERVDGPFADQSNNDSERQQPNPKIQKPPMKLQRISTLKQQLKRYIDLNFTEHCFYCGNRLPFNFPFCPQCQTDAPFSDRNTSGTILVDSPSEKTKRRELIRALEQICEPGSLPDKIKSGEHKAFLVTIGDDPVRTGDVMQYIEDQNGEPNILNPDDLMVRIRYNSWLLPIVFFITALLVGSSSILLSIPLFISFFFFFYRNLSRLNLIEITVQSEKLPGTFSFEIIKYGKLIFAYLESNNTLRNIFETIFYHSFDLIELVNREPATKSLFSSLRQTQEHFIMTAGRCMEILLILEKSGKEKRLSNGDNQTYASFKDCMKDESIHDLPPLPLMEEKVIAEKPRNFNEIVELAEKQYEYLAETLRKFFEIKERVTNLVIKTSLSKLEKNRKTRELVTEISRDITSLEQAFDEL